MLNTKRIVYNTEDGGVAIVIPAPNCGLTLEEIAAKDVPAGVPYKIMDVADLPADRTFRDAWEMDPADATDGVGADYGAGTSLEIVEITDKSFVLRDSYTGKMKVRKRDAKN